MEEKNFQVNVDGIGGNGNNSNVNNSKKVNYANSVNYSVNDMNDINGMNEENGVKDKKRQRRIKLAFMKMSLMAMLLRLSTYAWFTSKKDVTI